MPRNDWKTQFGNYKQKVADAEMQLRQERKLATKAAQAKAHAIRDATEAKAMTQLTEDYNPDQHLRYYPDGGAICGERDIDASDLYDFTRDTLQIVKVCKACNGKIDGWLAWIAREAKRRDEAALAAERPGPGGYAGPANYADDDARREAAEPTVGCLECGKPVDKVNPKTGKPYAMHYACLPDCPQCGEAKLSLTSDGKFYPTCWTCGNAA